MREWGPDQDQLRPLPNVWNKPLQRLQRHTAPAD
jgi:hypothetical protein